MKKHLIILLAFLTLSFTAAPLATFAQGEPGTEIVQPLADDTIAPLPAEEPGEVITDPGINGDVVLPDAPWGFDFDAYYATWLVFVAFILGLVQIIKKLLKWEGNKAFWLSVGVAVLATAAGYFFKLGAMATMQWYGAVGWLIAYVVGSKIGYGIVYEILIRIGVAKK